MARCNTENLLLVNAVTVCIESLHQEVNETHSPALYRLFVLLSVLQDLVKSTPTSHADYDVLQKALSSAQHFIENFDGTYKDSVR